MENQNETRMTLLNAVAKAFGAFRNAYEAGVTKGKMFSAFTASLDASLGSYELKYDAIAGTDSAKIEGSTDDSYVLQKGDAFMMDISVGKDGVWCDVTRTYFIGEATPEQRKAFYLLIGAIRAGESILETGASANEIYHTVDRILAEDGQMLVHHAGHLLGDQPLLPPEFLDGDLTPLQNGDVVTLEPGLYFQTFGIRLENDYLVSDDGAENLFEPLMPLKKIEEYILL